MLDLKHLAIIMDGNRRWARQNLRPKSLGHKKGAETAQNIIKWCKQLAIPMVTLYAFSTENWQRSQKEVENLLDLLRNYLQENGQKFIQENIAFKAVGDVSRFPKDIQQNIYKLQEETAHNKQLKLNIALNYGSLDEVVWAVNRILQEYQRNIIENKDKKDNIAKISSYEEFAKYLHLSESPDLLIRTGGQMRLSNFLLLQSAYTEFYFTKTLWPDFSQQDFMAAIEEFKNRKRNFGKET